MTRTFALGDTDDFIKPLQRLLNETFMLNLTVDGNLGIKTQMALADYQKKFNIIETDKNGACYGPMTQDIAMPKIKIHYLQDEDYTNAAITLDVDVASVKAFAKVESKEYGFNNDGTVVILFERHKFYKQISKITDTALADKCEEMHPDICNNEPGGYCVGKKEQERFNKACGLNKEAALMSTSYGLFQILGLNYGLCGYSSVTAFVDAMKVSERNQLNAFVNFIKSNPRLHKALINKDWATVAKLYNGPNYEKSGYHLKMANAYEHFKKG